MNAIVHIAERVGAWILADEVYAGKVKSTSADEVAAVCFLPLLLTGRRLRRIWNRRTLLGLFGLGSLLPDLLEPADGRSLP